MDLVCSSATKFARNTCSWNVCASLESLNFDSTTDCIFAIITSWFKRLTCIWQVCCFQLEPHNMVSLRGWQRLTFCISCSNKNQSNNKQEKRKMFLLFLFINHNGKSCLFQCISDEVQAYEKNWVSLSLSKQELNA